MTTAKELLQSRKIPSPVTVSPKTSLKEAIDHLAELHVDSLVVLETGGTPVGVLSEQDILKELSLNVSLEHKLTTKSVGDIMSRKLIIGLPEDSVEYLQSVMAQVRIHQIPIVEVTGEMCDPKEFIEAKKAQRPPQTSCSTRLLGVIRIEDTLTSRILDAHETIRVLSDYITGKYPG